MNCPNCDFSFRDEGLMRCPNCGAEIVAEQGAPSIDPPFVEVARVVRYEEAQMIKALLEGSGFEVALEGHTLHGSGHIEEMGITRLLVRPEDADAAKELVAEAQSEDFDLGISDEELEAQALAAGTSEDDAGEDS